MPDGTITFSTALDNAQLEKELAQLNKKILTLEKSIALSGQKRMPLLEQSKQLAAVLDEAKAKLYEMQNAPKGTYGKEEITEQKERVRGLQSEWNKIQGAVERYDQKIKNATIELGSAKTQAGEMVQQINAASGATAKMGDALSKVNKRMDKFINRVKRLASRVFVFTLITRALRSLRTWLGGVIKTNSEATAAIAKLKGAMLTLAQPIIEKVIPALTAFINVLTKVISAIAQAVSMLFGTTAKTSAKAAENLYNEMNALEGVGEAAEDAAGSLAGFDEINQLAGETASGGESTTDIGVDFDTSMMEANMDKVLNWIKLIGAALLAWRLSDSFLGGLRMFAGLILAINGAIELAKGTWDAWQNGVDWDNFLQMLQGAALLVAGLAIAFGKLGAGIGLVVSGLTMLVTGFRDAMENGWNLQNTLMTIAGIMATGLGISLLTGSYIPALIAAIASLLLTMTVATGHGEELIEGIRTILEGFKEFFTGIFSGDIEKAIEGIGKIFEGLKTAAGSVIAGVRDTILGFLDWLDEKTGGKFHGIIETAKGFVTGFFDSVTTTLGDILAGVQQYFTGIIQFITGVFTNDWETAWEGIKNIFKGFWNSNLAAAEGAINLIVKGLNWLIKQINKISFEFPDWVPGVGGKSFGPNISYIGEVSLPRLATGAVIPPNREFLAVLGDQKSGNNIEAPLATIEQALENVLARAGGIGGDINITVESVLDGKVVARNTVKHINDMTRQAGKPVLLI